MKRILILLLLIGIWQIKAQNPPNISWKQISTQHFNIIYEAGNKNLALKAATNLEHAFILDTQTFHLTPKKINVFLFNRSVVSNAYMRLAPRQMVWYTTPPDNTSLSITPWTELLAIHEYRHTVQTKALKRNFTKIGYILFGEYGQAFFAGWTMPTWFVEGDAVYNETIYTNSGRGRISNFDLHIRTLLLSGKKPKYQQFFFRSFKNFYPDHYHLGYFMVAHVNRNYGQGIWENIIRRTTIHSYNPFTFSHSLKKFTGYNINKTYKNTLYELDSLWKQKYANLDTTNAIKINKKKKRTWTNYISPYQYDDSTIICLKTGLDENPSLYFLTNNSEKKLFEIPAVSFSFAKHYIVWAEINPDKRWSEQNFSNIVVYDLNKNKKIRITKKGKYFSPVISPDGQKIVATFVNPDNTKGLAVFDLNGNILQTVNSPDNDMIRYPYWINNNEIVFTHSNENGQALSIINLNTGKIKKLIDYQWIRISTPQPYKNFILFNYDPDGIANIYAIDTATKEIFKVTSRPFGVGDFSAFFSKNKDHLVFSDYTPKGYNLMIQDLNPSAFKKIDKIKDTRLKYYLPATDSIQIPFPDKKYEGTISAEKDYKPAKYLLNFHSWIPSFELQNDELTKAGFYLFSDNLLHTLSLSTGLESFINGKTLLSSTSLTYSGFYPIISANFKFGSTGTISNNRIYTWKISQTDLTLTFPYNFSKGYWSQNFDIYLNPRYTFISAQDSLPDLTLSEGDNFSYNLGADLTIRKFMSYRDIQPRLGFSITTNFFQLLKPSDFQTNRLYSKANIYLPGIGKHHSLVITFKSLFYDQMNYNASIESYNVLPQGIYRSFIPMKSGFYAGAEYFFPICYPDFGIYPLIFFKRVRGSLFADIATLNTENYPANYSSVGGKILIDFHVLHFNFFMLNIGIQTAYVMPENKITVMPMIMDASFPLTF